MRQPDQYSLSIVTFHESFPKELNDKEYQRAPLYEVHPTADVESLLLAISPYVVHAHGEKSRVALACKQLGIPYVVTAHHGGIPSAST